MLTPIYQHHAENPWRQRFSSESNLVAPRSEWIKDGVSFHAYQNEAPGRIPIYEYRAEVPLRFLYSNDPNVGRGWRRGDNAAFYAYELAAPGTIPIYQYHSEKRGWRFLYSSDPGVGRSWINDGIVFFAVAGNIEWESKFISIEFEEGPGAPLFPAFSIGENFTNTTDIAFKTRFNKTITRSASHKLTTSSKFTLGSKLSVSGSVPFFKKASIEVNLSFEQGRSETQTNSVERTFSIDTEVDILPGRAVRVERAVYWADNLKIPFELKLSVSATGNQTQLTGNQVEQLYRHSNPDANVEVTDRNEIIVSLDGEFIGSDGIESSTKMFPICIKCLRNPCECEDVELLSKKSTA